MTKRFHDHSSESPLSKTAEALPLFAVPDIRTEAPSAPGSETSRRAALDLDSPFRRETWRRIMVTLYSVYPKPISRENIAERIGAKESSLCARLSELRPTWVESVDAACIAASGLHVDGYRLTVAGKSRCEKAFANPSLSSTKGAA